MAVLIEALGLEKRFGEIVAVDGISLSVPQGEVLGFLGPNGAGKSTTMKMLTGFLEPDAGSARIAGIDVLESPKLAKAKLGYLPEGAPCYGDMTARAFLAFIAEIRGFDRDEAKRRVDAAVEKTQLASVLGQRIETLSKGFKRRVAIAQVETLGAANGKVRLRALPSASAPVPSELAALIRSRLIEAEEVHVERGNLDDVFRQITTSDAGTSHA